MARKKEFKFEDAVNKLEKIVKDLEGDEVELEQALKLFEEGIAISKCCTEILDEAENKIRILMKKSDGSVEEKDYDENIFKDKLKYNKGHSASEDLGEVLPF